MVILFVALGGVIAGLGRMSSSSDDLGYNTMGLLDGAYNTPGGTSAVSHPVSGVALPVSVTSRTLFHHTAVPSYGTMATPALSGGSYAVQGLALTSQGAMNVFGGSGGSASSMGSTRTSSQSASYAMGGGSVGGSYRTGRSGSYAASTFSAGTTNSTFSPAVYAAAPAAPSAINNDFSTWGSAFNPLNGGVVTAADWVPMSSVGNRRRISSIGGVWLQDWINGIIGTGTDGAYYGEVDGVKTFREDELYQAYLDALNNGDMSEGVTWEQFKEWFTGKGYQFYDSPLPDGTLFLLLLAAMMTFITYWRRTCTQV